MTIKKFFYKATIPFRGFGLSKNPFTAAIVAHINGYFKSGHPESVMIGGLVFYIDQSDSLHLTMDPYEPEVTTILKQYLTSESVMVDIGANLGYHTIFAAKAAKQVIAFEPEQRSFALLQKNIKANDCSNVIAVNAAVSDVQGTAELYVAEENSGGHSMVYGDEEVMRYGMRKTISVPVVTIDSYLKDRRVDFIKMDIEGAEGLALKGALKTIQKCKPVVVTEFRAASLKATGVDPNWFFNVFEELGYVRKEIGHPKDMGDGTFYNYLFVPKQNLQFSGSALK